MQASQRLQALRATPNALAEHYRHAAVGERILLTGHSHQAWPDRGLEGQRRAWLDAMEHLDDKWERAFAKAQRVTRGYAALLGASADTVALGPNTHELLVRFLSGLDLRRRPRLVTSDGEFHTIRRQLQRLGEEGVEVSWVTSEPVESLAERMGAAVSERTAAVLVSSVLYRNARRVPGLDDLLRVCQRRGAELLVDVYHHLNVIPFSLARESLEGAFVVGGGYKYCQLGEGNGFLRFPEGCTMRPVVTGWFSEFEQLSEVSRGTAVRYGAGPARFAGATYDPTSHYRAAEVFDFFEEQALTPELLRELSQHQVALLADRFDALDLSPERIARDRSLRLEDVGGFLTLQSPRAPDLCAKLRTRGVMADARGDALRLGPAPYVSDAQLEEGIRQLGDVVKGL